MGLLTALVAALKADPGVAALCGDRVYDVPPEGRPQTPYLHIGPGQFRIEAERCGRMTGFTFRIFAVSQEFGRLEAWSAVFAAAVALDGRKPEMPAGLALSRALSVTQGGDVVDAGKLRECFLDVVAVVASTPSP